MSISNPSISPQSSSEGLPFHHQQKAEAGEPKMAGDEPGPSRKPDEKSVPTKLESILNQDVRGRQGSRGEEDIIKMHGVSSIVGPAASISEVIPATPSRTVRRRQITSRKRKKGKVNVAKQRAIAQKLRVLKETLKPIPFIPPKILYFSKHEKLLKKIGLWDFVHIDFGTSIRVDLIAQLVATYDAKWRCGYVDKIRVSLNRTSLARALKLPVKIVKCNVGGAGGLNLMEEEIEFIMEILSDWVLLHDDEWLMPNEVLPCVIMINDGHPEEVDWAGLFWFMVEKELNRGEGLIDCHYASHLQLLIRSQNKELLTLREVELEADELKLDMEAKEEDYCCNDEEDYNDEEDVEVGGVSVTAVSKEGPSLKDIQPENVGEEKEEVFLVGTNNIHNVNKHYVNGDSVEEGRMDSGLDDMKEKNTTEKKGKNGLNINVLPDDDNDVLEGDGLISNFLQTMSANYEPTPQNLISNLRGSSSYGKRVIIEEDHISHSWFDDRNKRLRTNDSFEQMLQSLEMCKMIYEEKKKARLKLNENRAFLLNQLQRRARTIEHLKKTKLDEIRSRDEELYRLKRELYLMCNVVDGYKKAVKETQKAFAKYREKSQLREEWLYKDVGCGGLMLSSGEIEKQEEEEDNRKNCLIILQNVKQVEEVYAGHFEAYFDKVKMVDKKLSGLEIAVKELTEQKMKKSLGLGCPR